MIGSLERFRTRLASGQAPFVLGITGGSGSGKTTLARLLAKEAGEGTAAILPQDSYYIDQSHLFDEDGGRVNFDHPSSIDFKLLAQHLRALKSGKAIEQPIYDFATHKRLPRTEPFAPHALIIVDGTLILNAPEVRDCLDFSIFVGASEELRFQRRLKRDVEERGRTPEGVRKQFLQQVKPMHDQFVEPSSEHANAIISGETSLAESLQAILAALI